MQLYPPLTWITNAIAFVAILCILWNLGAALFALLFDRGTSDKMLKALLRRMVLSVLLFVAVLLASAIGWIVPKALFMH
ncbi:MAG: DUF2909 domain-containing protein [Gammaproteobacteria bacterium]|nr:DUF2909 domain-containing protein [Gammaproteobacteria bacterium]